MVIIYPNFSLYIVLVPIILTNVIGNRYEHNVFYWQLSHSVPPPTRRCVAWDGWKPLIRHYSWWRLSQPIWSVDDSMNERSSLRVNASFRQMTTLAKFRMSLKLSLYAHTQSININESVVDGHATPFAFGPVWTTGKTFPSPISPQSLWGHCRAEFDSEALTYVRERRRGKLLDLMADRKMPRISAKGAVKQWVRAEGTHPASRVKFNAFFDGWFMQIGNLSQYHFEIRFYFRQDEVNNR